MSANRRRWKNGKTWLWAHNVLPWLQGDELHRLRRSLEYFLLNNQIRKATRKHAWLRRGFRKALGAPIRWRIGRNRYSFPWELWVSRAVEKVVTRRSLLTGQKLSDVFRKCVEHTVSNS